MLRTKKTHENNYNQLISINLDLLWSFGLVSKFIPSFQRNAINNGFAKDSSAGNLSVANRSLRRTAEWGSLVSTSTAQVLVQPIRWIHCYSQTIAKRHCFKNLVEKTRKEYHSLVSWNKSIMRVTNQCQWYVLCTHRVLHGTSVKHKPQEWQQQLPSTFCPWQNLSNTLTNQRLMLGKWFASTTETPLKVLLLFASCSSCPSSSHWWSLKFSGVFGECPSTQQQKDIVA